MSTFGTGMQESFYSSRNMEETAGALLSPYQWDTATQVGLPSLRDQLLITAASEFAFWQPASPDWLTGVVEATLNRIYPKTVNDFSI
jgi:hypothetical protein